MNGGKVVISEILRKLKPISAAFNQSLAHRLILHHANPLVLHFLPLFFLPAYRPTIPQYSCPTHKISSWFSFTFPPIVHRPSSIFVHSSSPHLSYAHSRRSHSARSIRHVLYPFQILCFHTCLCKLMQCSDYTKHIFDTDASFSSRLVQSCNVACIICTSAAPLVSYSCRYQ